jgi:hypothetical protein
MANKAVLAFENYFNEPQDYLGSALWEPTMYPKSAEMYKSLWGQPANLG